MRYNKKSLSYKFFYIIISDDTWRIIAGLIIAIIFAPNICNTKPELTVFGQIIVWIMIITLGWSISFWPANKISKGLQFIIKKFY